MAETERSRIVAPVPDPRFFRAEDGTIVRPPPGWALLPPGDATLTRRVKEKGPSWTIQEKKGNKLFSRGVLAPPENIAAVREALAQERATPEYARERARAVARRDREQAEYVEDFETSVAKFLAFSSPFTPQQAALARAVTVHATPVGSGTVARTERIPIEERAESAVIAWMRHQTTAYDHMTIERERGARREVRRDLARISRALLEAHRRPAAHPAGSCPLCRALAAPPPGPGDPPADPRAGAREGAPAAPGTDDRPPSKV